MNEQKFGIIRNIYNEHVLAIIFYYDKYNDGNHMLLYNADYVRGMELYGIVWLRKPTEYEQQTIYPALITGGWEYLSQE